MTTDCYANSQCVPTSTPVDTNTALPQPRPPTNDGTLPFTGGDVAVIVLIAALLIALGWMMIHTSRMGKFRG